MAKKGCGHQRHAFHYFYEKSKRYVVNKGIRPDATLMVCCTGFNNFRAEQVLFCVAKMASY